MILIISVQEILSLLSLKQIRKVVPSQHVAVTKDVTYYTQSANGYQ